MLKVIVVAVVIVMFLSTLKDAYPVDPQSVYPEAALMIVLSWLVASVTVYLRMGVPTLSHAMVVFALSLSLAGEGVSPSFTNNLALFASAVVLSAIVGLVMPMGRGGREGWGQWEPFVGAGFVGEVAAVDILRLKIPDPLIRLQAVWLVALMLASIMAASIYEVVSRWRARHQPPDERTGRFGYFTDHEEVEDDGENRLPTTCSDGGVGS